MEYSNTEMHRNDIKNILTTHVGFLAIFVFNKLYFHAIYDSLLGVLNVRSLSYYFVYVIVGIPIFISLYVTR